MNKIMLFILLGLLCFCRPVYSQFTLQAGGGAGIVLPLSDYAGSTIDFYNGEKYGLSSGYNLHLKSRVGVLGFLLAGEIGYSSLSNDGESEPGRGKIEVQQNILAIELGPEFQFDLPAIPVTPYLWPNLAFNSFSGETKFNGVSEVSSGTHAIETSSRFGLGISAGVVFDIGAVTSLDIALHYNMMNISGSKWEDKNPSRDQRIDSYLSLNDEKDPLAGSGDDDHFIAADRSITTMGVTVTILFGL